MPTLQGLINVAKPRFLTREARAKRLLKRSMKLYGNIYDDYWSRIRRNRALTAREEWFDRIESDGFCIVPDYLDAEMLATVQREMRGLPGFAEGRYDGPVRHRLLTNDGILALEVTEATPVAGRLAKENAEILSVARALYGSDTHLTAATLLNKFDRDKIDSSNAPHWDDWRVRFKAFLYLTDVAAENGPTIYVKGSHKARFDWRREKDYASMFLPIASAGGSWWPVAQLGLEKVSWTGKAGTLILFDALGIHSGTQLTGSPRIMLMSMYTTHIPYGFRPY
jgi:Phytanoyl-CoA dioxygenase (PhyH)